MKGENISLLQDAIAVLVYENQCFSKIRGWEPHGRLSWSLVNNNDLCNSIGGFVLPDDSEWIWVSNWKLHKTKYEVDKMGWEYA